MVFSCRRMKNDSVTSYILFDKDNSVTPYVFLHQNQNQNQNSFNGQVYSHIQEIDLVWLVHKT